MAALLLAAGTAAGVAVSPAIAQDVQVDFDTFHNQLAPYGDWVYSGRWGEVWIPTDVPDDFRPYDTNGHWVYTDEYGWTWDSDYEWGDIPFHYGRWVNDPDDGWMWIPGYVWSPGWVVWRHYGQYTGWMPMPPDDAFLGHAPARGVSLGISIGGLSISFGQSSDDYGYSRWYGSDYGRDRYAQNWVFVGTGHITDRDYRRYEAPRSNYATIIRNSKNVTNYKVVNNYIVNKSIDPRAVQKAGGHVQTMRLVDVIKKPQYVTRADTGAQIQQRARADRPHGTGFANSAPKPPAAVVQSLSAKAPPAHGGHAPMHLFTRDTVDKAPFAHPEAGAKPGTTMAPGMAMPGMKMPEKTETKPATPAMAPTMSGPPAETKKEEHMHEHAPAAPATLTAPTMNGPVTAPTGPKHEHVHENATTPATPTTPTMNGPMTAPLGLKHEHVHENATTPATPAAPTMSGPMTAPTEPKHEHVHEHTVAPATVPTMNGPMSTTRPMHEEHAAPPKMEHAAPAPKDEKAHEKPKKPDDTQPR
jgi:hypothetical protein